MSIYSYIPHQCLYVKGTVLFLLNRTKGYEPVQQEQGYAVGEQGYEDRPEVETFLLEDVPARCIHKQQAEAVSGPVHDYDYDGEAATPRPVKKAGAEIRQGDIYKEIVPCG